MLEVQSLFARACPDALWMKQTRDMSLKFQALPQILQKVIFLSLLCVFVFLVSRRFFHMCFTLLRLPLLPFAGAGPCAFRQTRAHEQKAGRNKTGVAQNNSVGFAARRKAGRSNGALQHECFCKHSARICLGRASKQEMDAHEFIDSVTCCMMLPNACVFRQDRLT